MKTNSEIISTPRTLLIEEGEDGVSFSYQDLKHTYFVIASRGNGWDHVSVSCKNKKVVPTWEIMNRIKDICFYEDEVVMQLHPKKSEYVNVTENCLHLWKPQDKQIPTPPMVMV